MFAHSKNLTFWESGDIYHLVRAKTQTNLRNFDYWETTKQIPMPSTPPRATEMKSNSNKEKAYAMLKEVHGNEYVSRTPVFEWFKRFKEGHAMTEDDPPPGRPSTSKTDENIANWYINPRRSSSKHPRAC
ncbi:hypothetical protein NQ318_013544 [Aromia moschata]|uniref:Mos1 transposase HTH domain-containing protein n=1 Tax=Aromia moschata TaxID=1265417 RepID=A0AAV8XZN6_9CUCU|nr:hypothetical protein NQ318_013544 [Aromia moschata]